MIVKLIIYFKTFFMRAVLKPRPQSRRIRVESASGSKKPNKEMAEEYFNKAKSEQMSNKFEKAIELYMRSTGFYPYYFQAFCNMGYCYRALGKYAQAKRCYLNSLFINKEDPISHYNLANLYRILGQNQFAIKQYSFLIDSVQLKKASIGNLFINSLINIGICYKNEGHVDQAVVAFRRALVIDPCDCDAQFNLAICLIHQIQSKQANMFRKLYRERSIQAEKIFKKIAEKNPLNYMVKFSLIKISVFLNNSSLNIEEQILNLKEMVLTPQCDIKDQINQYIAHLLNSLEQYEESSRYYQGSLQNLSRRKIVQSKQSIQSKKNGILFEEFSSKAIANFYSNQQLPLTEALGIKYIQQGDFKTFQHKIKQLQENSLLKQSLTLMLYLKRGQIQQQYLKKANHFYQEHFENKQNELPDDKLSIQTHKAIGKILSLSGKYEESVKHYQFISEKLKNNRQGGSAKLHSELGEGYEQSGNIQKALQQYKRAIQIQPDNYTLTYNMGYCLYESQNFKQAAEYFTNILDRIKTDVNFNSETRELYEADCMIILALSNQDEDKRYELYSIAFNKLQDLKSHQRNELELLEDNLLIFLIEVSQVVQKKLTSQIQANLQFKPSALLLLQIYSALLDLDNCPDADEILINSGNLYYQLNRYSSAIHSYEQVSKPNLVPEINQALAYAHLIQPVLASKHIQHVCNLYPNDIVNTFSKEIINWMYFNESKGDWNCFLPELKADMFYQKYEYGLILLDKLSAIISQQQFQNSSLIPILQGLVKQKSEYIFRQQKKNIKFKKIKDLINKYDLDINSVKNNILSPSILKICFSKSQKISQDFLKLVNCLSNIPKCGRQFEFYEAAIHLFIYNNQLKSNHIRQVMQEFIKKPIQQVNLFSKGYKEKEDLYTIFANFKTVKQFILTLKQWEAVLEEKVTQYIQIIEEFFYSGNIFKPIEFQYHFPRNLNLLQSDQTFEKVVYIVLTIGKYTHSISCRGNNVSQMREDLIKQFENKCNVFLQQGNLKEISLTQSFLPVTLYLSHETLNDCQLFVDNFVKRMDGGRVIVEQGEQLILIVDKLVRIICKWSNPYEPKYMIKEAVENIVDNPMFLVNQSIIYLEKIRKVIQNDSQEAFRYMSLDSTLYF